jgi:predicted nucleotidyltransferase
MRKIRLVSEPEVFSPEKLQLLAEEVCREQKIDALYFFGGAAGGSPGRLSDIDLAFYSRSSFDPLTMQNYFATRLKRDDIDLVDLKTAPPLLAYHAVKEGKLIFCRNDALRILLEYSITSRYLSTIHLREEFHRNLSGAILGGGFYGRP